MTERPVATPDEHPQDAALAERLRDLLAERGRATNGDVRAVLDGVSELPDRGGGRRSWLAAAAAIAVLALGGAFVLGRISFPTVGTPTPPVGRDAFAGDPRLTRCEAETGTATQVFQMIRAEWFPMYFPGWYRGAPELEVADPALVVIGPQFMGGILGVPLDPDASSPAPTRPPTFFMCIAVGPPADSAIHTYGPTSFDRIVPVLSDADVARAEHLDPEVLADPAVWRYPDRLAPCGGVTGNEQYVFEASHLSDFSIYFPNAGPNPFEGVDEPAVVVVYRDPLSGRGPSGAPDTPTPGHHDICAALEVASAHPDHMLLPEIDTTGFHVRIDKEIDDPPIVAPGPTIIPDPSSPPVTPEPALPWAGDTTSVLDCLGAKRDAGLYRGDSGSASTPEDALRNVIAAARYLDIAIPIDGYAATETDPAATLFLREDHGRTIAAIAIVAATPGSTTDWVLGSASACDAAEFDPSVPTGIAPIGSWFDDAGAPVPESTLSGRDDCYGGTQIVYRGHLYVRVPFGGVDTAALESIWSTDATLPKSAVATEYRSGDVGLFESADGTAIFFVSSSGVEELPHVTNDEVVRTDCN